jgi:preprotein translocase subunit SecG
MSTTVIILILAAIALIIAVILAAGEGGPRITRIDRTVRHDQENIRSEEEGDER